MGEIFNPARDCADIVDNVAEAEDGFYWISLDNKTEHKVFFMIVGILKSLWKIKNKLMFTYTVCPKKAEFYIQI